MGVWSFGYVDIHSKVAEYHKSGKQAYRGVEKQCGLVNWAACWGIVSLWTVMIWASLFSERRMTLSVVAGKRCLEKLPWPDRGVLLASLEKNLLNRAASHVWLEQV
jgi:hypothetical protein